MLQLTPSQMKALAVLAGSRFRVNAMQHLRACEPHRFARLPLDHQRSEVDAGIDAAHGLGLTTQHEVLMFLDARCLIQCISQSLGADVAWANHLFDSESADLGRTVEYIRDLARERLDAGLLAQRLDAHA